MIRIKNIALAGKKDVLVPNTKMNKACAETLVRMGYLDSVRSGDNGLRLELAFRNKSPYITDIKIVSKPGLRIYKGVEEIERHKGPSQFLISTPKGIKSSNEAKKEIVGGEIIAEII